MSFSNLVLTFKILFTETRLQKVYILTSVDPDGANPTPDSEEWTFRYYRQDPFGSVTSIILEQGVPSRYVAVFCAHNDGLVLAEVKVYSFSK